MLSLLGKNFPKTLLQIFSESHFEWMWYFKIKITATPSEIFYERSFIFSLLSASIHSNFFVQSFIGVLGDSPNKSWYRWSFLICEQIMKGNTYTLACWVCFFSSCELHFHIKTHNGENTTNTLQHLIFFGKAGTLISHNAGNFLMPFYNNCFWRLVQLFQSLSNTMITLSKHCP